MDHERERELRLREAIEACRPGSDDVSDPAFGDLREQLAECVEHERAYRRVQGLDARVADAFKAVAGRDDLSQRILGRLAAAQTQASPLTDGASAVEPDFAEPLARSDRPRRGPRRKRLVVAGAVLAAVAAVVIAVWIGNRPGRQVAATEARDTAVRQFDLDYDLFATGKSTSYPEDLRPSSDVRLPGARWRWVKGFLGRTAVAYDARLPAGRRATLYVVRIRVADLGPSPPPTVTISPGQPSVAAWKSSDLVYVLVFDGGRQDYRRLLAPQGPIT